MPRGASAAAARRGSTAIVWFRRDLRLHDHTALHAALTRDYRTVIPLFIYAPEEEGGPLWAQGAASRRWLHDALVDLDAQLQGLGSRLVIRRGPARDALRDVVQQSGANAIFWHRVYEPRMMQRDADIEAFFSGRAGGGAASDDPSATKPRETSKKRATTRGKLDVDANGHDGANSMPGAAAPTVFCESFLGDTLFDPETIKARSTGGPFKIFTPFWKRCQEFEITKPINTLGPLHASLPTLLDESLSAAPGKKEPPLTSLLQPVPQSVASERIESLELKPRIHWDGEIARFWDMTRAGGERRLLDFTRGGHLHSAARQPTASASRRRTREDDDQGTARTRVDANSPALADYDTHRDLLSCDGTSRLSPYLHFGQLSAREIHDACVKAVESTVSAGGKKPTVSKAQFRSGLAKYTAELAWREFGRHMLVHFPNTPDRSEYAYWADFGWTDISESAVGGAAASQAKDAAAPAADAPLTGAASLRAWQKGRTGVPIVDAGMRQLWAIGWMHNRARMITGSFLVKHLLIHWVEGEKWFWDTLVDADLANNAMGWQWVAGTGVDANPFFRIFNPVTQGEKFDSDGAYVRQWVPELAKLPDEWIQKPWLAPADVLEAAGVVLGTTYPLPIVDLQYGRQRALTAFATAREKAKPKK